MIEIKASKDHDVKIILGDDGTIEFKSGYTNSIKLTEAEFDRLYGLYKQVKEVKALEITFE